MITPVTLTRRAFLASSAGALAVVPVLTALAADRPPHRAEPHGPVPARTGPEGLAPGSPTDPSRGEVVLLDGRTLVTTHTTHWRIGPGRSVLIAPEPDGTWSLLYAEC